jgi:hypothetical protein
MTTQACGSLVWQAVGTGPGCSSATGLRRRATRVLNLYARVFDGRPRDRALSTRHVIIARAE